MGAFCLYCWVFSGGLRNKLLDRDLSGKKIKTIINHLFYLLINTLAKTSTTSTFTDFIYKNKLFSLIFKAIKHTTNYFFMLKSCRCLSLWLIFIKETFLWWEELLLERIYKLRNFTPLAVSPEKKFPLWHWRTALSTEAAFLNSLTFENKPRLK